MTFFEPESWHHGSLASKRLENQVSQNFRDSVAKEQSLFYNVSFRAKQQSLSAEVPRKFATLHASPGEGQRALVRATQREARRGGAAPGAVASQRETSLRLQATVI